MAAMLHERLAQIFKSIAEPRKFARARGRGGCIFDPLAAKRMSTSHFVNKEYSELSVDGRFILPHVPLEVHFAYPAQDSH